MEQVLLGVAGVGAEMGLAEMTQTRQLDPPLGEIKLAQRFHDPDIHRKGLLKSIAEQQHAIGDFQADPGQLEQLRARLFQRHAMQRG